MDGGERRRADLKSVCFARHTCRHPTQCPFSESAPAHHHQLAPVHFHGTLRSKPATSISSHSILPRSAPQPRSFNPSFQKHTSNSHSLNLSRVIYHWLARQITFLDHHPVPQTSSPHPVLIVFPSSLPSTSPLFSSSPPNVLIYRRILTVKTEPALIYLFISPRYQQRISDITVSPSSRPKYPPPLDLDATSVDRIHPSYFWPMLCYKLITPRPYIVSLPTSRPPVYHSPELDIRYPWG